MITYPVDVAKTLWAVFQVSKAKIIARNKIWPVADGSAIPSLDPDFIYLLHNNDISPDYDPRLFILEGNEIVDIPNNAIKLTWLVTNRPNEERQIAAENVEAEQLSLHIKLEREAMETRLMVGAILNFIDGLQFPPKVDIMAVAYKQKAIKLWKNRDRLNAILQQITNGQTPDLDIGWEPK